MTKRMNENDDRRSDDILAYVREHHCQDGFPGMIVALELAVTKLLIHQFDGPSKDEEEELASLVKTQILEQFEALQGRGE